MGAWIETVLHAQQKKLEDVAPRVGAWIETADTEVITISPAPSHPVWVRGLKQFVQRNLPLCHHVAPRVGAWIETDMLNFAQNFGLIVVAPRVGAWIETL